MTVLTDVTAASSGVDGANPFASVALAMRVRTVAEAKVGLSATDLVPPDRRHRLRSQLSQTVRERLQGWEDNMHMLAAAAAAGESPPQSAGSKSGQVTL